ncbi:MAG: hypothetical protein PHY93_19430 [Bacteriovorax sp.]|nr:hypothetical protein [Bacteriovorax sp.]
MKKNLVRTITALVISITGIFLSYYFLYPNIGQKQSSKKSIAMAKVINVINDVKKQGNDKLIWEPIRKGDLLYLGEKLKTSPLSSSKIEFIDNGASIDIEPESLIIVNKNNQKLSLQVVEGSLFVSSSKEIPNLSVTSGEKSENTMNIKNGDFSYSVSKEGKANVEVLKGTVDPNSSLIAHTSQKFKDLKPGYGENIFVDSSSVDGSIFKWSPLPDEYEVKLEIGNNRNNLQIKNDVSVESENGLIRSKSMTGSYYWRLVALNKNNPDDHFSSSTFKVTFKQKIAPIPIYPIASDTVQLRNENAIVEFKWSLMHSFDSIQLEIFSEGNTKNPILTEQVTTQTFFSTNKINRPGKYSWKLVGKVTGSEEPLVSLIQYFQIFIGEDLQSPMPLLPLDKSIFYYPDQKDKGLHNLHLSWKNIKEASEYLIIIKNRDGKKLEFKAPLNQFVIPTIASGTYSWTVQSINLKNEISKAITNRSFSVEPMAQLSFNQLENKVYYTNKFPTYKFIWNTINNAENYRLKVSQSQSLSPNETIKVNDGQFNYQIGKEGMYFAQVEALNKEENSIAQSEVFTFSVTKPPLPSTPVFLDAKKALESTPNGDINFELINFDKKYKVVFEIRDTRGVIIEQSQNNSSGISFKSLSPGRFFATAKYIDEFNQTGELSLRQSFTVPDKSAIAAPKVKGIKVR